MIEQNICYELSSDQRFPSTSRISIHDKSHLKIFLTDVKGNIDIFLNSNGEKMGNKFKEFEINKAKSIAYEDIDF